MEVSLSINNKTSRQATPSFFENIAAITLEIAASGCERVKRVQISLALVGPAEMRSLNRDCRAKDKVTDVLSFAEYENKKDFCGAGEEVFLGEIILCPAQIEKSARQQGLSLENESAYVFSHGVLHLVGYDHEEEMFAIQDEVVEKVILIK